MIDGEDQISRKGEAEAAATVMNNPETASGRNPPQRQSASDTKRGYLMKLDEWFTRLVTVPPGQSPLAYGLAIGMRIALFVLVPLGIIAAIAILLLHR